MCDVRFTAQIRSTLYSFGINGVACAIICHRANEGVQHLNVGLGDTIFLSG